MRKARFAEAQIVRALAQESTGRTIAHIDHRLGESEQAFHRWKRRFGPTVVAAVRWFWQLEDEDATLKPLAVELGRVETSLQHLP